jgi:hypothetical protein
MKRLLRYLGSLQLAVILLVIIGIVLAWGTLYEVRFGTASVHRYIYRSWWLQGLLGFLAVNLGGAAVKRYPWQSRHAPFLLAHLGIILILLGAIIGGVWGLDGQMAIAEGEAQRVLQLSQNVIAIQQPASGFTRVFPVSFETQAWNHAPNARYDVALGSRRLRLTVEQYFPNADVQEAISNDGLVDNPAVQVELTDGDQRHIAWLFARDAQRQGLRWGPAHMVLMEPPTEEQLAQILGFDARAADQPGTVTLPAHAVILIQHPAEALSALLTDEAGRAVLEAIELGRVQRHPGLGYTFEVKAAYARGRIDQRVANRNDAVRAEAVQLTLSDGSNAVSGWLRRGESTTLQFAGEALLVGYQQAEAPLPVSIKLLDFRRTNYPGTQMPSGFESDVQLSDAARGVIMMKKISMNNPLTYRGLRFFQSSVIEGPVETTMLSVRRDPGTPVVYAGFLAITLGLGTIFLPKPFRGLR